MIGYHTSEGFHYGPLDDRDDPNYEDDDSEYTEMMTRTLEDDRPL